MSAEGIASFPSSALHGAALAARTHAPEPDTANRVNPQSVVERVNAYGLEADVMAAHPEQATPPEWEGQAVKLYGGRV